MGKVIKQTQSVIFFLQEPFKIKIQKAVLCTPSKIVSTIRVVCILKAKAQNKICKYILTVYYHLETSTLNIEILFLSFKQWSVESSRVL